jgi:TRAP-type mannitol/chloroaromatic compound transport system permease large subunit
MIPGLMLVGLYILYQLVACWLKPELGPAIPREESGRVSRADLFNALVPPIVLVVAVLGSILGGIATPTEAAAVGAVGATLLAGLRIGGGRPWPIHLAGLCAIGMVILGTNFDMRLGRDAPPFADRMAMLAATVAAAGLAFGIAVALWRCFRTQVLSAVASSTLTITAMIFATLIGATLFALVFRGLGGEELVKDFLSGIPGGTYGAILVVMLVIFLMGFFLDFVEITIIVIPIVGPILLAMGVDPIWLGVMIAINLQTSFLTPPFGFSLFYLAGVAPKEIRTSHIYKGIVPFVAIQLLALGLVLAFPALATWLPGLLF